MGSQLDDAQVSSSQGEENLACKALLFTRRRSRDLNPSRRSMCRRPQAPDKIEEENLY